MTRSLELAREVISLECDALNALRERLGPEFAAVTTALLEHTGRVSVIGMGKSGIIGQKIAATFASTGTAAYFVHPAEAFHGDLGMIGAGDIALLISYSGETEEVVRIIPFLKHQGNMIISMTGAPNSTLGKNSKYVLDISVKREACANNLAPTASTTVTLALGDALAVTLSSLRNFQPADFARFHPGGSLGRRLLQTVGDLMRSTDLPVCRKQSSLKEVIMTVSQGMMGVALVVENDRLVGLITNGDIRRCFERGANFEGVAAQDVMTTNPVSIQPEALVGIAEDLMRSRKVSAVPVVRDNGTVAGIFQIFS